MKQVNCEDWRAPVAQLDRAAASGVYGGTEPTDVCVNWATSCGPPCTYQETTTRTQCRLNQRGSVLDTRHSCVFSTISPIAHRGCVLERLGFFSEKLKDSMVRFNLSQQSTAARLGCSYEHVRKMVRGECWPSQELLRKLCSIFEWEIKAIEKLRRLDDARRRFGPTFWTVLGKDPRAEPFYILWPYLSREERNIMVISMSGCIAARKNKSIRRRIRTR